MKETVLLILYLILLISDCSKRAYFQTEIENPACKPNTVFRSSEDSSSPKSAQLVEKGMQDAGYSSGEHSISKCLEKEGLIFATGPWIFPRSTWLT